MQLRNLGISCLGSSDSGSLRRMWARVSRTGSRFQDGAHVAAPRRLHRFLDVDGRPPSKAPSLSSWKILYGHREGFQVPLYSDAKQPNGMNTKVSITSQTRRGFPGGSAGKESACNAGDPVQEIATHSSILAWRIPWTEKPGVLQSTGWQRVRHN